MNETLNTIKRRRSIRAYKPEQIKKEELRDILEAALFAPTGGNRQPWHFTVIQDKAIIDEMSQNAKEIFGRDDNSPYQERGRDEKFHIFYHAPTVIVVSGQKQAGNAPADCAAAMQNILLAAESLGLGSCWVNLVLYLFRSEEGSAWEKKIGIPEGYRPMYTAALGYKAYDNPPAPPRNTDCINYL